VIQVDDRESVPRVRALMDQHSINAVPVFSRGRWGICTRGDLVRAGFAERLACETCGSVHHVRRHPLCGQQWMCVDCLDQMTQLLDEWAGSYVDFGGGD
jgi:CBS domain-containing protein